MKHGRPRRAHAGPVSPRARRGRRRAPRGVPTAPRSKRRSDRSPLPFAFGVVAVLVATLSALLLRVVLRRDAAPLVVVAATATPAAGNALRAPTPTVSSTPVSPTASSSATPGVRSEASPSAASSSLPTLSPASIATVPPISPAPGTLVLSGLGSLAPTGSLSAATAWRALRTTLGTDDLSVGALICAATIAPTSEEGSCQPFALAGLDAVGIDVLSQASVRAAGQGSGALLDSLGWIGGSGMKAIGAGPSLAPAVAPTFVERDGWRIAVVGFAASGPASAFAGIDRPGIAGGPGLSAVLAAISRANASADVVVVDVEWGVPGATQPEPAQESLAARLVAAGADVIFGRGSGNVQRVTSIGGRPVFFDLGSIVGGTATMSAAIARVSVSPAGEISVRLLRLRSTGLPALA